VPCDFVKTPFQGMLCLFEAVWADELDYTLGSYLLHETGSVMIREAWMIFCIGTTLGLGFGTSRKLCAQTGWSASAVSSR